MSESCDYGCATLPDHEQVLCNDYKVGGISSAGLIECDANIADYTDPDDWNTAISNGTVKLINGISGEIPEASPVMVDNPIGSGAAQILIGVDNTITFMDMNVSASNDDFYAKVNLRKMFLVVYNPANNEIRVSAEPVVISALPVTIPKGNRNLQGYKLTATFFTDAGVIPMELFTAPTGIFV